jgi:iron(III) transport system substrate-binding protein
VVAIPGIATRLKHVPNDYEQRLVKNDFAWMAQNRDAILAEWQKRYANKSEAKK